MSGSNDFLPFAVGGSPNVASQAAYVADGTYNNGFLTGLVHSPIFNKALRQASFVGSCFAQYMANTLGVAILDDGNVSAMLTHIQAVLGNLPGTTPHSVPYQSAAGVTSYTAAPTTPGQALIWNGTTFVWGASGNEQYVEVTATVNTDVTFTYSTPFTTHSDIPFWTVYDNTGENFPDQVVASVKSYSLSGCVLRVGVNGGDTGRTVTIGVRAKGY